MRQYLLTCETVNDYPSIIRRLKTLPVKVVVRIPIQRDPVTLVMGEPKTYVEAFKAIREAADIMIAFADSDAMKHFAAPADFEVHVRHCLDVLGPYCHIGEAGNEVNGNWLGEQIPEKVQLALEACRDTKLPTAVTYLLSANDPKQMHDWIRDNPLASDYALISHYPKIWPGFHPDIGSEFAVFAETFRQSRIGWGEYGTEDGTEFNLAGMPERAEMIRTFERDYWKLLAPKHRNYVGMGGYWDWETDHELDDTFKSVWRLCE